MRRPARLFRPSALDERLLVSALEDRRDVSYGAWREVRERVSLDDLGHTAFELLPLIYRNLSLDGHEDDDLPRLRGVYRRTWVKNNLLIERTRQASDALGERRVHALFVEGATLASRFYPELGLRPSSVIDILVDAATTGRALAALAPAGWREPPGVAARRNAVRYLYDVDRNVLALRPSLGIDLARPREDVPRHASLLAEVEQHHVGGGEVPTPRPTETLFALIVLNARLGNARRFQWVVDAKMVLRSDIDWQRLATLADGTGQISRVRDALGLLAGLPGPRPPDDVNSVFSRRSIGQRQRVAYVCTTRIPGGAAALLAEHLAATADRPAYTAITGLPDFLRDRWNLRRSWDVPLAAGRRVVRSLRGGRRSA